MRLFLGSEGTFGVITEATMRITRLPETRLFRALLFKDVATGLEAGRRMMVERLDPLVIRMYDQHSTASLVKRVLGYELKGAYMIIGFDGWAEIADGAGSARAGDLRRAGRARSRARAGREAGGTIATTSTIRRTRFHLPAMYGTIETVATFDKIEEIYHAKKAAIEGTFGRSACEYIGHFSHWFPWGASLYDRFVLKQAPQDPARSAGAARPDLGRRRPDVARARRDDQRAPRRRAEAAAASCARSTARPGRCSKRSSEAIDPNGIMNPGKVGFEGLGQQ